MRAEIITIGDELLIGQVVDTNSSFIAQELDKIGIEVSRILSISDEPSEIMTALHEGYKRSNLVILTGGLGPTNDDVTKGVLTEFLEDSLVQNEAVVENIQDLFSWYHLKLPLQANLQQAMVPSRAEILMNVHGTAPGLWVVKENVVFVALPGVPFEMKHLLKEEVLPRITGRFQRSYNYHKTLLTYGMGESAIAARLSQWEENLPKGIKLGYLPSLGKVRLRLSSNGPNQEELLERVDEQMDVLQEILSDVAVGLEEEATLPERIGKLMTLKKKFLSTAESCTGGKIAAEITKHAGASSCYKGGIIPYETSLKTKILGVPKEIIDKYNVVSTEVAESMAVNACRLFESDYAIATTGIAGPTKGDGEGEVGDVCIAIATPEGVVSDRFQFGKDRFQVMERSTNKAFEMLWKEISKI